MSLWTIIGIAIGSSVLAHRFGQNDAISARSIGVTILTTAAVASVARLHTRLQGGSRPMASVKVIFREILFWLVLIVIGALIWHFSGPRSAE